MKHFINLKDISSIDLRKIILDVNEKNLKAIKFYKKHNFIFSGRRKNYYRNKQAI